MKRRLLSALAALLLAGCNRAPQDGTPARPAPDPAAAAPLATEPSPPPRLRAPVRSGSGLARAAEDDALYLADEDHRVLWRIPLPVDVATPPVAIQAPGAPAQVLALAGRVLVTIRDPGLLLVMQPDPALGLVEVARVPLPDDAWGLAVTPDERVALATSAWAGKVSAVEIDKASLLWTLDVPREPRAVVVREDGTAAYVTHLVGPALTRIDALSAAQPAVRRVLLPPSPLRAPAGSTLSASLSYSASLSPDGSRFFVARHALGALGEQAWYGASTVDVMLTASDEPLAPGRRAGDTIRKASALADIEGAFDPMELRVPNSDLAPFVQPRALAYRKSTRTLLVASEGSDALVELDALSIDPTLRPLRTYRLGERHESNMNVAGVCGAPSAVALSADETVAWVYCRSTGDLAIVRLDAYDPKAIYEPGPLPFVRLAEDDLSPDGALGRRLFYNATDWTTSGGLGCAGCHPEGRDDGHVWHEVRFDPSSSMMGDARNFLAAVANDPEGRTDVGVPRQTPMLAGRVAAEGPYGWNAQSEDLVERLREGFGLHRWGSHFADDAAVRLRARYLAAFLRGGLVPPPRTTRPLNPEEERGQALFVSDAVQCSTCHVPASEYTDRTGYTLPRAPAPRGFEGDPPGLVFKTPSLRHVGGTAPYYHDGSARTLEELVANNHDRMGKTSHLSTKEQAALVAFLRTL
jgi:hypothetical protein